MIPSAEHELVLTRLIDASPEALYRCWTDASLAPRWFAPAPWTAPRAEFDLRPGGRSLIVMADPEGNEYPNEGVFLELVPNRHIVTTDAYTAGWVPSAKPFMTSIITFTPEGDRTRYTATVRHWTAEDKENHEKMGFHEGWGQCADQLAALASTL